MKIINLDGIIRLQYDIAYSNLTYNDQITDKECSVRVNRRFKKLKEYYNYYKNEPIQLLVFLFYITFFLLILFTFWVIYKIFKLFFIIINRLSRKAFNSKLFNIFRKKKIV